MDQHLTNFQQVLKHILFCQQNLEAYKMNPQKIQKAYFKLDIARRGSLNVSDIQQNFSDLNQEELFHIFKSLDISRTGYITLNDLMSTVQCSNPIKDMSQKDPLSAMKFCIKIMQLNYQQICKKKLEYEITVQSLGKVFDNLKSQYGSSRISAEQFILFFKKNGSQFSEDNQKYIKQSIFGGELMNLEDFIDYFKPFSWPQIPELSTVLQSQKNKEIDEKQLKYQTPKINQINIQDFYRYQPPAIPKYSYNYYQNFTKDPINALKKVTSDDNLLSKINQRQNTTESWNTKEDFLKKRMQNQMNPRSFEVTRQGQKWKNEMNKSINNTLSEIQKRREELRKGSIERQNIVDSIMNRNQKSAIQYGKSYMNNRPPSAYLNSSPSTPQQFKWRADKYKAPRLSNEPNQTTGSNFTSKYSQMMGQINPQTNNDFYINSPKQIGRRSDSYQKFSNQYRKLQSNSLLDAKRKEDMFRYKETQKMPLKTSNSKIQLNYYQKTPDYSKYSRPYPKSYEYGKNFTINKENILKKAEEEATKKIQQIQRKARMKVMEKRSNVGMNNYWIK